jgi:hypothetical protein
VLADFDRDGFLDAAVENFGSNDVRILLGLGNGTFAPARTFHVGVGPGGLAAADFNGDGFHDLAVANHTSHNLSILLNEGHGQFRALQPLAAGGMPAGLAVDDLDHDGRLDLAAANNTTASVSIFQARPLGPSFRIRAPTHIPVGIPIGISVAPIDERGQTFADYSGTARFTTSIELPRGWPKEHTFTPSNNGVFGTEIAFPRPGYYHLRVIDKQNPDHAGAVTVLVGYVEDAQKSPLP